LSTSNVPDLHRRYQEQRSTISNLQVRKAQLLEELKSVNKRLAPLQRSTRAVEKALRSAKS
jgi:chromosome segregation ATPase